MLDTYAVWTEGAKESDIETTRRAMESASRAGILAINSGEVVSVRISAADRVALPAVKIEVAVMVTAEAANAAADIPVSPGFATHSPASKDRREHGRHLNNAGRYGGERDSDPSAAQTRSVNC